MNISKIKIAAAMALLISSTVFPYAGPAFADDEPQSQTGNTTSAESSTTTSGAGSAQFALPAAGALDSGEAKGLSPDGDTPADSNSVTKSSSTHSRSSSTKKSSTSSTYNPPTPAAAINNLKANASAIFGRFSAKAAKTSASKSQPKEGAPDDSAKGERGFPDLDATPTSEAERADTGTLPKANLSRSARNSEKVNATSASKSEKANSTTSSLEKANATTTSGLEKLNATSRTNSEKTNATSSSSLEKTNVTSASNSEKANVTPASSAASKNAANTANMGSTQASSSEQTSATTVLHSQQAKNVETSSNAASRTLSSMPSPVPLQAIYRGGQSVAQEVILPNGLKILFIENHEFPVVSTLVWYRVGSRDEQAGATGLSHMVEHLMFQEVGAFKSGDLGSTIARVGGQFNGYTSDDFTTFFETLPANKLEMALKIESDRMLHTRFSPNEVRQEISNINKEFDNEAKDPVALVSRETRAALYTQHPYHNPTLGKKSDMEGLSAEHARAFYEKYFHPDNATLIISGDVNPKHAMSLVHKYFASAAAAKIKVAHIVATEPAQHSERRVNVKYAGNKDVLQVAYRAPAMDDADAPVMVVLERLLNGGTSGKLKSVLIDNKVCASAQASYEIKKEPGVFSVTCTANPNTAITQTKTLGSIDGLIAQLRDKPPAEADVRRARNQAEFSYFAECDGPYRAGFHLGYFDCLDKWQNSYTWADRIRAVSPADLSRVAKKYLTAESRVVGIVAGIPTSVPKPPAKTSTSEAPKEHDKTSSKVVEHVHLTGYKQDDGDDSPHMSAKAKAIAAAKAKKEKEKKDKDSKKSKSTAATASAKAKADKAKVAAATAAKPKERKSGIPAVIHDIPSALGAAVTGNIPGAVTNVGAALINIPGAIGNIGTAVGSTATALGKQIVQVKPAQETEFLSHHVLKNGINIVVFQSHISPLVQITGSLQAGEAYAPRNKAGYSLLAASLLNQGSVDHNRAQMIAAQDDMGIASGQMLKFDSDIETIDFSTRCLSRDLPAQLGLLAETLVKPDLLDDGTIDKAQQEALGTLKRSEENVVQKADRVLLSGLLDENSPFCPADPSDRAKTITQSDLTQAQKFFSSHVVPGATTIVFAGDVNPEQVYSLAEKAFGDWDGKTSHAQMHAKARTQRVLRSTVPIKDSKKTSICFGQVIPLSRSNPEYGSLLVADSILVNHPMFSRFEKALSKTPALENAIANGDMGVKLEPVSNLTRWSLSLSVDPSAVPLSIKTVKNELRQIANSGVTNEEFTEVKRYLLGSLPVRTQATLGSISNSILDSTLHSDTINGYASEMASVKAASVDSVNRLIRNTFKPAESTIVIAGGAQSIKSGRSRATDSTNAASAENAQDDAAASDSQPVATKPSNNIDDQKDTAGKTSVQSSSDSKVKQQD